MKENNDVLSQLGRESTPVLMEYKRGIPLWDERSSTTILIRNAVLTTKSTKTDLTVFEIVLTNWQLSNVRSYNQLSWNPWFDMVWWNWTKAVLTDRCGANLDISDISKLKTINKVFYRTFAKLRNKIMQWNWIILKFTYF
mgnify:CR=1 FL=1